MNHIYRIVWNESLGSVVAVSEAQPAHGRSRPGRAGRPRGGVMRGTARFSAALAAVAQGVLLLLLSVRPVGAEPTGGQISAGAAGIAQSGALTVVTQSTNRVAINWQSFNIGSGETVRFVQPGASSIALNRVVGTDGSRILGQLQANGQVFLINPNGILFGRGAQVDVGSLVASTLALGDADFMAGRYRFGGDGAGIRNEGRLVAHGDGNGGGYVVLMGSQVSNTGDVVAQKGTAALAAGRRITLDFAGDGLVKLSVDEGALKALVDNGGLVQADGGTALLTARAADALRATVVNNTGIVQARTLENRAGVIKLLGGVDEATGAGAAVGGTLDASAPSGGDGGFIETSGAVLRVAAGTQVTTAASRGQAGTWLIDPTDLTISAGSAPGTTSGIGADTLATSLANGNVTLATAAAGSDAGNLIVNAPVTWTSANALTLQSQQGAGGIQINAPINFANGRLNLLASGSISASAAVSGGIFELQGGTWSQVGATLPNLTVNDFRISGGTFTRAVAGNGSSGSPYQIADIYGLQGAGSSGMLSNSYVLASDINAAGTVNWNGGAGWLPVGNGNSNGSGYFTGSLDGLGHTVSGLTMNRPSQNYVGLFGDAEGSSILSGLTLNNVSVAGGAVVGGLAGVSRGIVNNVRVSGSVVGSGDVGGLVGVVFGSISNSYNLGTVNGQADVGGLVGSLQPGATLQASFNAGAISYSGGATFVGGLVGALYGTLLNSYNTGTVSGTSGVYIGGAVGIAVGNFGARISNTYSTGTVSQAGRYVGGLVGIQSQGTTISNSFWNTVTSGQSSSDGGTGLTTAQMTNLATFTSAGWDIDAAGGTSKVWRIYDGNTMPLLRGLLTPLIPAFDGSGTALANIAGYSAPVSIDNSKLLGSPANPGTLTLTSTAAGSYTASLGQGLYSTQLGYDVITSRSVVTPGSAAGDVRLDNGAAWTNGTLAINTSGTVSSAGAISGGTGSVFDLQAGTWRQVGATLPGFAVNDFRVSGGTFIRALGGDGTTGNPYQMTDAYGLQGMGSRGMLSKAYLLASDIDASSTPNWNGGAGWTPVGGPNLGASFTGDLNGQGRSVNGLTIYRPNQDYVGLFGLFASGTLGGLALNTVSVTGRLFVGALAGVSGATINGVRVNGSVMGLGTVGGLVGYAFGGIANSYNVGTVDAAQGDVGGLVGFLDYGATLQASFNSGAVHNRADGGNVGGLVGYLKGSLLNTYTTGSVSGIASVNVGGAVGYRSPDSSISNIYSSGVVSGSGENLGGLIGLNEGGAISNSYWNATTSGQPSSAGGIGLTAAQMTSLSTFMGAGWNIDAAGGTGKVWRIYNGSTMPLLRSFMTGLDLSTASGSLVYSAGIQTLALPAGVDASRLLGGAAAGRNVGPYASSYYSTQLGYDISGQQTLTITAKPVTVTGLTANSKVYDATTVATLNTAAATASGLITGDAVSLNTTGATGSFADKNVGTAKAVTVTGEALTGASAGNYVLTQATGLTADITAKSVMVSGVTANSRVYDATNVASLNTGSAIATGLITGDAVSLSNSSVTGSFADKNVGTAKTVTVSGETLIGASAGNYVLAQPTGLTADITAKAVTVSGVTANSKVYDATSVATLNTGSATANGLITGDAVILSTTGATGSFADKNVGTAKAVTVTGETLTGASAGNYVLTQSTGLTADITAKSVTVSGVTANSRVYDATTVATLNTATASATGLITGDAVSLSATGASGSFADKNVGTAKAVTVTGETLTGASAGNYVLTQSTGLSADITTKAVTVSGVTANGKVYDATTVANLNTATATAAGLITGDAVSLNTTGVAGSFADKNVGTAKAVTVTGTALAGASAGNYTLSQPSGLAADITAKGVTVSGVTANGKVYDATTVATLNTGAATATGLINGDAVSLNTTGVAGSFADKNVGTAKAVTVSGTALTGASAGNYALSQPTGLAADITTKSVTVSGVSANSRVYDATTTATLNTATATANGLITGDAVSLNTTGATGSFADKNVGTAKAVTVTGGALTGASASNYLLTQPTGLTADIAAKSVTVSGVTANTRVYDATNVATLNTGSATASGLITGDAVSLSTTGATGSFADKNVGTAKAVTVTGETLTGASAGNYVLAQSTGLAADITAKAVTVSGLSANGKVYDATTVANLNTGAATATGLITGDAVSLNTTGTSGSFADKNVGTAKAVTVSGTALAGASAGNYTLNQPTGLTADITAKAVTVGGVSANGKVYDAGILATLNTATATASGLISGDVVGLSTTGATGSFSDKNVGTAKAVTVTGETLTGASAGNYVLTQSTGLTADITAKPVTVSGVTANGKVYDATMVASLNTATASATGLITGDAVSLSTTGVVGSFADKNVGTAKAVTVSGEALTGASAGNYVLTQPTGLSADITAKAVTVSGVTANSKVYDATTLATLNTATATANGLIAGDAVGLSTTGATGSFADKNLGTAKAVTVTGETLTGASASNYVLTQPTGLTADITAKAVTVSGVTANSRVYDATNVASLNTGSAIASGLITGDAVSLSNSSATGSFADKNVGTSKTVTVSGETLIGASAGNYVLAQPTGLTADITAKAVTVSGVTANSRVYDATTVATLNTGSAAAAGLINGDAVSLSTTGAAGTFANKNVGTGKAVTVTGTALTGASAGNYALVQPTGLTADITTKAVTVSGVTANGKVYDAITVATLNTGSATANGLISGDAVSLSTTGATGSFADKNVGTAKAVTVTGNVLAGASAGNYTLSQPSGITAAITARPLDVTGITAANKVYDGSTAATLNTGTARLVGVLANDQVALAGVASGSFADKNVGAAKPVSVVSLRVGGADASNYLLASTLSTTANITPKALTLSGVQANNKIWDGLATATFNTGAAQLSGLIGGDQVSLGGVSGVFSTATVGVLKPVTVTGTSLGGTDARNYTVTAPTGLTANILPGIACVLDLRRCLNLQY